METWAARFERRDRSQGAISLVFAAIATEHPAYATRLPPAVQSDPSRRHGSQRLSQAQPPPDERSDTERVSILERELAATADRLAASTRSNDEYQDINEELQSANEALLATREEYQMINQELRTINGELAERLAELARANDEAATTLRSSRLAMLLLDGGGRMRSFTPRAAELFGLRDVSDASTAAALGALLSYPDLEADLGGVLLTAQPAERRMRTNDGVRCIARMLPHRPDGGVTGVVLVFLEIG